MRTSRLAFLMWLLGALFYCFQFIIRTSPGILEKEFMQSFCIQADYLGFMMSSYYFAYAPLQILVGVLLDHYGPRLVMSISIFILSFASLVFSQTKSFNIAIITRFFMGLGSASAMTGTFKILSMWFPHNKLPLFTGLTVTIGCIGAVGGVYPLTCYIDVIGDWRLSYFHMSIIGFCLSLLFFLIVKDKKEDFIKGDTFRSSMTNIVNGLKTIIYNQQIWLIAFLSFCLYTPLSVFADFLNVSYIQAKYQITKVEAASVGSAIYIGVIFGATGTAMMLKYFSGRFVMIVSSLIVNICLSYLIFFKSSPSLVQLVLFILGFFTSAVFMVFAFANNLIIKQYRGMTYGLINMIQMLSGAILLPIMGFLIECSHQIKSKLSIECVKNYDTSLYLLLIICSCSLIFCFFLQDYSEAKD